FPFITDLADELVAKAAVDPKRIYVVGFSTGGWAVSWMIVTHAARFAAFGVHGAGYVTPPGAAPRKGGAVIAARARDANVGPARMLNDALLAAGWMTGVDLIHRERPDLGHEYDASTNADQWGLYAKFSLP